MELPTLKLSIDKREIPLGFLNQIKHDVVFGNSKSNPDNTAMILTNLGGKIECFDKISMHSEMLFVLGVTIEHLGEGLSTSLKIKIGPNHQPTLSTVVKQPDTYYLSVITFDPKANEFDRLYVRFADSSIHKIRIREKFAESSNGVTTHSLCFISGDGDFVFWNFDLVRIKSEGSTGKLDNTLKPVTLNVKSELKVPCMYRNGFTCFDLLESMAQGSECFKMVLGSQNGSIFSYVYSNKAFHLTQTFNHGANFYISDIKFQIPTFNSSISTSKNIQGSEKNDDSIFTPHFFSLITMDGILKIFLESKSNSVYELQMQNKPLRSLCWDSNISLMFFIDESDRSLLTAVSFSNPVEPNISENIRKNIKLGSNIEQIDYAPENEKLISISSENIISIGSLPVA